MITVAPLGSSSKVFYRQSIGELTVRSVAVALMAYNTKIPVPCKFTHCTRGSKCNFVHTIDEFNDVLDDMIRERRLFKTSACQYDAGDGSGCGKSFCRFAHVESYGDTYENRELNYFSSKFGFNSEVYTDDDVPKMLRPLIPSRDIINNKPQSTKTSFAAIATTKMPQPPKGNAWADDLSEQNDTLLYAKAVKAEDDPQPGNNASSSKDIDAWSDNKEDDPQPGNNASSKDIDAWSDNKEDDSSVAVVGHDEDDVQSNISSLRSDTSRMAHSEPSRVKPDMPILNIEREAEPTNDMPHTPTVWNQPQQQNNNMVLVSYYDLQMILTEIQGLSNKINNLQIEVRDTRRAITEMQYDMADMRRSMRA